MTKTTKKPKFQLTRSVGSVTNKTNTTTKTMEISTHTLRGERDAV